MLTLLPLLLGASLFTCTFSREWARAVGLLRTNVGGRRIPTGVAFWVILLQAGILLSFLRGRSLVIVAAAVGFSALGLYDDLISCAHAGERDVKGWRAHARRLLRGHLTSGMIKALGGAVVAVFTVGITAPGPLAAVRDSAVVALSANFVNALDLAPGRAVKGLLCGFGSVIIWAGALTGWEAAVLLLPLVVFGVGDLRGRHMMGDAGANGWGAMLGAAAATVLSAPLLWVLLAFLCAAQLIADRPGFTAVIEHCRVLRALDRLGRPGWN